MEVKKMPNHEKLVTNKKSKSQKIVATKGN